MISLEKKFCAFPLKKDNLKIYNAVNAICVLKIIIDTMLFKVIQSLIINKIILKL